MRMTRTCPETSCRGLQHPPPPSPHLIHHSHYHRLILIVMCYASPSIFLISTGVCQRAAGVKGCDCFRVILRNGIKVMENAEVKRMWIVDWFVCAWDISHGALEDSWWLVISAFNFLFSRDHGDLCLSFFMPDWKIFVVHLPYRMVYCLGFFNFCVWLFLDLSTPIDTGCKFCWSFTVEFIIKDYKKSNFAYCEVCLLTYIVTELVLIYYKKQHGWSCSHCA